MLENYIFMAVFGGLLIVFNVRSLYENSSSLLLSNLLLLVQIFLSFVFAILSGTFISFLIFYECRISRCKIEKVFLPCTAYTLVSIVIADFNKLHNSLPYILFNVIILLGISFFIFGIEYVVFMYMAMKEKTEHVVSITAINEMYEKKLNHELIIKNYLSERNARLEERESISRNIHNSVGHSVTAAIMTLEAADMLFDTDPLRARKKMHTAKERIQGSLDAIRHAVRVLDEESEYIEIDDFIKELHAVADDFIMDTMIKVYTDFNVNNRQIKILHEHTEFLIGAVKEFLSNGVRHGGADVFIMVLAADSTHIKVSVGDNGRSDFSDSNCDERIRAGFGLKKIISYVKRCGGEVSFTNSNGFKAEIIITLEG